MEVQCWPSKFHNPLQHLLVNYNNPHSNILFNCSCYAPCRVRSSDREPHLNIIMVKCTFKISLFLLGSMFPFYYLIVPSILNFGITFQILQLGTNRLTAKIYSAWRHSPEGLYVTIYNSTFYLIFLYSLSYCFYPSSHLANKSICPRLPDKSDCFQEPHN